MITASYKTVYYVNFSRAWRQAMIFFQIIIVLLDKLAF